MMLEIGLLLLALAVGVGLFTVLSTADEKSTVRASLRQLDGYEVDNVRDQELLKPVSSRTVKPMRWIMRRARSPMRTGLPMSSTNTSPPSAIEPAWITNCAASGMVMK